MASWSGHVSVWTSDVPNACLDAENKIRFGSPSAAAPPAAEAGGQQKRQAGKAKTKTKAAKRAAKEPAEQETHNGGPVVGERKVRGKVAAGGRLRAAASMAGCVARGGVNPAAHSLQPSPRPPAATTLASRSIV